MSKVLNLDDLGGEVRTITLKGVTHEVIDMTVEGFIEINKVIDSMPEDAPISVHIEHSIAMICRRVPTLTPEDLKGTSMEKLRLILSFLKGDLDDTATTEGAAAEKK